jgi:glyoxylase-like metal-dependent hydrolase (beta-lactamase superfamily II)
MTISRPETQIDVSRFMAAPPPVHHKPLKVAQGTYLIRQLFGEGESPLLAYNNSMVILGSQPTIVDTGGANNREAWLNDVFSLVDPQDVRWIFISHDDHDHTGNLAEALALCPNATLVTTWFQVERLAADYRLPLDRMLWLEDGESFDAGDRVFAAVRPPVFDSPTTRGLYDSRTGVYWASDAFAAPVTTPMDDVSGLHPEEWRQGLAMFNLAVSPWIEMVDATKFNQSVCRIAKLQPTALVSAHTPAILGDYVTSAIDMMHDLPGQPLPKLPAQAELDQILASIGIQR